MRMPTRVHGNPSVEAGTGPLPAPNTGSGELRAMRSIIGQRVTHAAGVRAQHATRVLEAHIVAKGRCWTEVNSRHNAVP